MNVTFDWHTRWSVAVLLLPVASCLAPIRIAAHPDREAPFGVRLSLSQPLLPGTAQGDVDRLVVARCGVVVRQGSPEESLWAIQGDSLIRDAGDRGGIASFSVGIVPAGFTETQPMAGPLPACFVVLVRNAVSSGLAGFRMADGSISKVKGEEETHLIVE